MLNSQKNVLVSLISTILFVFSASCNADWFTSAEVKELINHADAGDVNAQLRVGLAYDEGNGAPKSRDKAMKYYLMAAEQGMAEAQNSVGSMLQAEKKYDEARSWYEKAAAQNHSTAINNLAYFHDLGLGVPQDRQKGFELYSRSADLGNAEAMWNIANMYGAGQLGKIDLVNTCVWTVRAQRHGSASPRLTAHTNRVLPWLRDKLSIPEWSICQQEGTSWSPQGNTQAKATE